MSFETKLVEEIGEEDWVDLELSRCSFCKASESKLRCSKCKVTRYCNQDHQIKDWNVHKMICDEKLTRRRTKILYCLGLECQKKGMNMKAIRYLTSSLEANPVYKVLRRRAQLYQEEEKYESALGDYDQLLMKDSILVEYKLEDRLQRGFLHRRLKNYDKALLDFNKCEELGITHHMLYEERGLSCLNLQKYESALKDFNRVIRLGKSGKMDVCYMNRGTSHMHLKDYKNAIFDFTKSIELNPRNIESYCNRGIVYLNFKGNENHAIQDFTKAIELDPNDHNPLFNRGRAFFYLERFEESIDDFSKAISLKREYYRGYQGRGNVYYEVQKYEEAKLDFNKGIDCLEKTEYQNNDDNKVIMKEMLYSRHAVSKELGQYEDVVSDLNKCIELSNPRDKDLGNFYYGIGLAFLELKKYEKSIKAFIKLHTFQHASLGGPTSRAEFYGLDSILKIDEAFRFQKTFFRLIGEQQQQQYDILTRILQKKKDDFFVEYDVCEALNSFVDMMECVREESELEQQEQGLEIYRNVDRKYRKFRNQWFPFLSRRIEQEEEEEEEKNNRSVILLCETLQNHMNSRELYRNLIMHECVGLNPYSRDYRVSFFTDPHRIGEFVIRIFYPEYNSWYSSVNTSHEYQFYFNNNNNEEEEKEKEELRFKEVVPKHPNISNYFTSKYTEKNEINLKQRLPDYDDFWSQYSVIITTTTSTKEEEKKLSLVNYYCDKFVFMKRRSRNYTKTLEDYAEQRFKVHTLFCDLEIMVMLKGLLYGVKHLHDHRIVHLDINLHSVVVDELFGIIMITDFSVSMDFRRRRRNHEFKNPFLVKRNSELEYHLFLQQQQRDDDDDEEEEEESDYYDLSIAPELCMMDYENVDLFSVGSIGYYLKTQKKRIRVRDERQQLLKGSSSSKQLGSLILDLIKLNQSERIGHEEAVKRIEWLIGGFGKN